MLGPVQVLDGSRVVSVPGGRVRTLLAALLLHANRTVSLERIVDLLWHQSPPEDPQAAIHTTMSRLRHALGDGGGLIRTGSRGYLIALDEDRLDLSLFRRHVDRARRTGDVADRVLLLGKSLELWRDVPLADVRSEELTRVVVPQLVEERLDAVERWIDARLELGQHAQVIAHLAGLTAEHPLRERFWAQTMLALYHAGRPTDALDAYRRAAVLLADELGLDPSPRLQALHQQVLVGDPVLSPRREPVPRFDLPRDGSDFTGREAEVRVLLEAPERTTRTAMVVFVIDGMGGVGKTALAVHAARLLADRYPDAQLFIDLRANTLDQAPLTPADALEKLLRASNVPSERIPADLQDRAALWRTRTTGRRTLVVLDNALDTAQVSPLLPGTPECLVLITSRRRLAGLDSARALTVDVLPPDDAAELFSRVVGDSRPAAEPHATAEVVELCGRLPLAIGIAGARLRHRPMWTVRHFADRLRDRQRLTELRAENRDVAAVFELSYRHLSVAQQRMFRLLGLHPGRDVDSFSAAAVAGVPLAEAEVLLEDLVDTHLLTQPSTGRYRLHDLLRVYAAERGGHDAERHAARTRLFDYYLHSAAKAMDAAFPHERHRRPDIPVPATPVPPVGAADRALAWLDTERASLLSVATEALDRGEPLYTVHLSGTLYRYLHIRSYVDDALTLHGNAVRAARMIGHRAGEGTALHNLGTVHLLRANYGEAFDHYDRALTIFLAIGDRLGQANTLGNLGLLCQRRARYDDASRHYRRALAIFVELGDRLGEANALGNLGLLYQRMGRHTDALNHFHRQLGTIRADGGDRSGEANAMNNIGLVHEREGRDMLAYQHFQQADGIFRALADRAGEAYAAGNLARVYTRWTRYDDALHHQNRVLTIARETGQRDLEISAYNGLGDIHRATAHPDKALTQYRSARRLAEELGDRFELAQALSGISAVQQNGAG